MDISETLSWLDQHATPLLHFLVFAKTPVLQWLVWQAMACALWIFATQSRGDDAALARQLSRLLFRTSGVAYLVVLIGYAVIIATALEWSWTPSFDTELRFLANQDFVILMILLSEAALIPILVVLWRAGASASGTPRWLPPRSRWAPTLIAGALLCAIAYLYPDTRTNDAVPSGDLMSLIQPTGRRWLFLLHYVLAITAVPVLEELLFRGVLFELARRFAGTLGAILITTIAFAAIHASPERLPILLGIGLALALLREVGKSLGAPTLTHAILNA